MIDHPIYLKLHMGMGLTTSNLPLTALVVQRGRVSGFFGRYHQEPMYNQRLMESISP